VTVVVENAEFVVGISTLSVAIPDISISAVLTAISLFLVVDHCPNRLSTLFEVFVIGNPDLPQEFLRCHNFRDISTPNLLPMSVVILLFSVVIDGD